MSYEAADFSLPHTDPVSYPHRGSLPATTYYVTVTGLGGEPDYEQHFAMWAKDIEKALKPAPDAKVETLVNATREQVRTALDGIAKDAQPAGCASCSC